MTPESDSRQRRQRSLSGPHTQVFSRQNGEVLHAGRHHSVVIGEEFGIGRRRYASLVRKRKCGGRGINGGGGGGRSHQCAMCTYAVQADKLAHVLSFLMCLLFLGRSFGARYTCLLTRSTSSFCRRLPNEKGRIPGLLGSVFS